MTNQQIELRERLHHRTGEKLRGDREIWIGNVKYGHIEMTQHGSHGSRYTFYDALGNVIQTPKNENGYSSKIIVKSTKSERFSKTPDMRPLDERLRDKTREIMASGIMPDPEKLRSDRDARMAKIAAGNREARERDNHIRQTLIGLAAPDREITDYERAGLALAFKEIFHGDIDKAGGDDA